MRKTFGFITDLHLTCKSPKAVGYPDFLGWQLELLDKVLDIYQVQGIHEILLGGDIFHKYTELQSEDINRVAECFEKRNDMLFYTIYGNHDLKGDSVDPKELKKTSLGVLLKVCENLFCLESCYASNYSVKGISWNTELFHRFMGNDVTLPYSDIYLVHAPVTKDGKYSVSLNMFNYNQNNMRLVLLGDQHGGIRPTTHNGVVYYNPGAFGKLAVSDDLNLIVPIISLDPTIEIEEIDLPVQLSFDNYIKKPKKTKIIKSLSSMLDTIENISDEERVKAVGIKEGFDPCYIQKTLDYMNIDSGTK